MRLPRWDNQLKAWDLPVFAFHSTGASEVNHSSQLLLGPEPRSLCALLTTPPPANIPFMFLVATDYILKQQNQIFPLMIFKLFDCSPQK